MLARTPVKASILGLGLLFLGCSEDSGDDHPEHPAELTDVVYVGRTTDEALASMLDRNVKDSEAQRLVIDSPVADAVLSKDEPALISYRSAISGSLSPREPTPGHYVAPHWTKRALTDLVNLVGPVRSAHAHGTPFSGLAYFLEVDDADGNHVLRVFTDQASYQPESVTWAALPDFSQPLTLTIVSAIFENNAVVTDGGPHLGGSVQFRVE
jgi:hypothetical protein